VAGTEVLGTLGKPINGPGGFREVGVLLKEETRRRTVTEDADGTSGGEGRLDNAVG
jgi:hypothetical protein